MSDVTQYETDVAIVGAGGAGIAAGIEARERRRARHRLRAERPRPAARPSSPAAAA